MKNSAALILEWPPRRLPYHFCKMLKCEGRGKTRRVHRTHNNNSDEQRLNPHVTSAATVGDLTAEEKREGDEDVGSLPRTLSTSVLRIKHRRSFWEKVVGYVIHTVHPSLD